MAPAAVMALLLAAVGAQLGTSQQQQQQQQQQPHRPNILLVVADDMGWADVGWHRTSGGGGSDAAADAYAELATPVLSALAREGVELDRHYAYKFCSPSRCALISGRNPLHINVLNLAPEFHNPNDLAAGCGPLQLLQRCATAMCCNVLGACS